MTKEPVMIQISLAFCETYGRDVLNHPIDNTFHFNIVSDKIIRLNNPFGSGMEFVNLEFDNDHFCKVDTGVYYSMLEFKWRSSQLLTPGEEQAENLSKTCTNN